MVPKKQKILQNYPFEKLNPPVILVEGCKAYDGAIGDEPGKPHKGIDFVRKKGKQYLSFDVFSSQDGKAFQGLSETWGKFVSVRQEINEIRLDTIYVHLDEVNPKIPVLPGKDVEIEFVLIKAGEWLGTAGITGNTKGITQLHWEMHRKNLKTGKRKVLDPYGVYDRASSGKYSQPGESLKGLSHYFASNNPKFAKKK